MLKSIGELTLDFADDGNIPVDIWLVERKEQEIEEHGFPELKYRLSANNYMPRKARLGGDCCYHYISDSREELQDLVRTKILPIYETALTILKGMSEDSTKISHLYYWDLENAIR